jgi:hypothetical protein
MNKRPTVSWDVESGSAPLHVAAAPFGIGRTRVQARQPPDNCPEGDSIVEFSRPFWDPASGRFDPVRLRAAIVSRGWAVGDFASAATVSRACLYNALRGWAASDRTVIKIAATLATREPLATLATG